MRTGPLVIRVVALGDSLTVGFQSYGILGDNQTSTPYTEFLSEHIEKEFPPSSLRVEVINKGVVGELTEQMLARFNVDVVSLRPGISVVLGGSNDLGWGLAPREVFLNLHKMYQIALENKIEPISCTVPSILGFDAGIPSRKVLNELIQQYSKKSGLRCVDLFSVTVDPKSGRLASRYSSDGLHLNKEGYREMARAVYKDGLGPVLRDFAKRNSGKRGELAP